MQVPRDQSSRPMAPMSTHAVAANGVPKLAAGPMLLLMATVVMPNVPVATVTPTRVLMPTETRTLMLLVTAMPTNTVMDVSDPALTTALKDGVAGKLESTAPPMPVLGLKAVPNMVLMAVTGKMPAVTATLLQTPLHAVLADGALVLRVQLMLLLARMAGRTATSTVVMPRTPTVMNMVLLMPALADTVAATLMAVALVLLATLPTLVDEVLQCVSVLLVEIVQLVLVEVAMPMSTLELVATADPLDTAELPVTADLLATADTLTATAIT